MNTKPIIECMYEYKQEHGTTKGYYEQWGVIRPVLGQLFAADAGISLRKWNYKIFKIIFIDDRIAVGLEQNCKSTFYLPEYRMFCVKTGWKHNDNRAFYRLRDLQQTISLTQQKEEDFEHNHPAK